MAALTRFDIMNTEYPAVRRVMGARRERIDDAGIEDLLVELFPGAEPPDVEDFMRDLQRFGSGVAPVAQRALPGALQGAAQGGIVAGPWGAAAGAVGGGVAGVVGGTGRQQAPRAPPQPGVTPGGGRASAAPPVQAGPVPAAARLTPTTDADPVAAAQQLLALLCRNETMQALLALLMSNAGRPAVQVGSGAVPAAEFANAISELAAEAGQARAMTAGDELAEYLVDDDGNPRGDIINPAVRASLLLDALGSVAADEVNDAGWFALDETAVTDDPLGSYEAALEGRSAHDD